MCTHIDASPCHEVCFRHFGDKICVKLAEHECVLKLCLLSRGKFCVIADFLKKS